MSTTTSSPHIPAPKRPEVSAPEPTAVPYPGPTPTPPAPTPEKKKDETPKKQPKTWRRSRAWIALGATAFVCLGIGGISSSGRADEAQAEAQAAQDRADEAETAVDRAEDRADQAEEDAKAEIGAARAELDTRSAGLDTRQAELDTRQAGLDQREAAVTAREAAVQATLAGLQASQFGDGIYEVGRDIQSGKYHTEGGSCYYATLSDGSGSFDSIIDNNNIDGPATIVIDSPYFEASGPCTWTKVG